MKDNSVRHQLPAIALFLIFIAQSAFAEEAAVLNRVLGGASGVQQQIQTDPAKLAAQDRRNQAGESADKAGTGAGAHAGIGAALLAAGIPMAASIIPAVHAAGIALIIKAGMEFAQAGADRGVQDQNMGQDNLIAQQADQGGQQLTSSNAQVAIPAPPELEKMLADRGINSDDFMQKLTSGKLNSAELLKDALGETQTLSPEDQAKGDRMADAEFNKMFTPESIQNRLGYDERNATSSAKSDALGMGGGVFGSSADKGGVLSADARLAEAQKGTRSGSDGTDGYPANVTQPVDGADGKESSGNVLGMLLGLGEDAAERVPELLKAALEKIGILKPSKQKTIFQVASQNYLSFSKWRKLTKLAKN